MDEKRQTLIDGIARLNTKKDQLEKALAQVTDEIKKAEKLLNTARPSNASKMYRGLRH